MTVTQTVTILTPERLTALGQAFFAAQATGDVWVCDASIDDLVSTILERRERLRGVVETAPDASFNVQPENEKGEPVWSAGQLADHVANAQYDACEPAIIALTTPGSVAAFVQPPPADQVPAPPILSREAALARLDAATPDYERLLDAVPRNPDRSITLDHLYFGTINIEAMLLISAWHEQSHAGQIQRLAE